MASTITETSTILRASWSVASTSSRSTSTTTTTTSSSSSLHFRPSSSSSSSSASSDQLDARLEEINRRFASARDDLEDAKEDEGTTYFPESYNAAHASVHETLEQFEGLVSSLDEGKAAGVRRSMGLKMLQLKAELDELEPH